MQQTPFGVCFRVEALGVSREWLTGGASDKDANMILGIVIRERFAVEITNALSDELHAPIVVFVSMSAGVVGIIACDYRDSSVKQAAGKSTCSAEQINRFRHQRTATRLFSSETRRHAIGPYLCSKAKAILGNG
jgi:hypothetical protein